VKNYKTIQALRGLAAFAVMMFHYRSAFNLPFYPLGENLFISGNMGVPLFFVISGFVMGLPDYDSGARSAWVFSVKRVARIVPLYLFATIIWCYVSIPDFSILRSGADLCDIAKAIIFYPMGGSPAPLFGAKLFVGWTLNYEMLFYGVLALGILVGRPWIMIAAVFGCTLWALPATTHKFSMDPFVEYGFPVGYLRVATNPIVWNFLSGVFAARLVRVLPSIGKEPQLALCIATSIAVVWQCFSGYRTG
jgi:peptidoglycan/LPS O-acetylase OafA/YrhL